MLRVRVDERRGDVAHVDHRVADAEPEVRVARRGREVLVVAVAAIAAIAIERSQALGGDDQHCVAVEVLEDHVEHGLLEAVAVDDHDVRLGDAAGQLGGGAEAVHVGAGGDGGEEIHVVLGDGVHEVGD